MIPIAKPMIGPEEIEAATRVLESGQLAQGPEVEKFEEEFAEYIGVDHAVAVSNGSVALLLALRATGCTGKKVHTTSFSFISTATSLLEAGCDPVFHDVGFCDGAWPGEYRTIRDCDVHSSPLLLVHLYGSPVHFHGLSCHNPFIEDCAQSIGSEHNGKKVGSIGMAGCFSFYATKNMTTGGEGGMVTTNYESVADSVRLERNHGDVSKYNHVSRGFNYRMTDVQAAIGRVQLSRLDRLNSTRIDNASYYHSNIDCIGLSPIDVNNDDKHTYHQFVLRVTETFPMSRGAFCRYLMQHGIGCSVHYPKPIPYYPMFGPCIPGEYPNAVKMSRQVLSIPVGPWVTEEDRRYIVDTINGVGEIE